MKNSVLIDTDVKSIFIVDDAPWHNLLLKKMLSDSGYEVHTFTDGHALLKSLEKKKPHLIISDINMPELDGFELYQKIKTLPFGKDIPVMYVSSLQKEEIEEKAKANGAVGFMQKPLSKQLFLDVVAQKL